MPGVAGAPKAKDGAGIPHCTLSQLGRTALAAPGTSVMDEGTMLGWRILHKASSAPLQVFLFPGKLQGEGSENAQLGDLGSDIWRRKSHSGRKLEIHSLPILFFFFFNVFQHESLPFSYSAPEKKNLHAIILLN